MKTLRYGCARVPKIGRLWPTLPTVFACLLLCGQAAHGQLVGYYTFDGMNAIDGSGLGNDGSVQSGVMFSSSVPTELGSGNAAMFTNGGSNGLIQVPNSASLQGISDTLTASFWINLDHAANPNWIRIMRKATEAGGDQGWMITRHHDNSDLLMRTDTLGMGGAFNQNRGDGFGIGMLDGTWHHYTHVRDNGTWIEYVDGMQTGSGTYPHGNGFSNTQPLQIGGRPGQAMTGSLDDVAIFTRRLQPTEISALAAGNIAPTGLVGEMFVDDTEGNWSAITPGTFNPIGSLNLPELEVQQQATDLSPFDLEIVVDGIPLGGDTNVVIDTQLENATDQNINELLMTLGTGLGDNFAASDDLDGLSFDVGNTQENTTGGALFDPAVFDDLAAADQLQYLVGNNSGLPVGDFANFLIGINVSDEIDGVNDGRAVFTLRQQVTPEPASLAIWSLIALAGLACYRFRCTR